MPRQLQANKTQLVQIRITSPGEIDTGEFPIQEVEGKVVLRYVDTYGDGSVNIEDRFDKTYIFSELAPQELAAIESLVRVFQSEGQARLGLT